MIGYSAGSTKSDRPPHGKLFQNRQRIGEIGENSATNGISYLGGAVLLTAQVFSLTAEQLCLQSVEVLLRHTFPLQAKKLNCKQKSSDCK